MTNDSQLTKKERAQLKQEEKARERAAQTTNAQRTTLMKWAGGLVALAAVIGLLAWAGSGNNEGGAANGDDWIKGAADAPVTLIEYSDFQCPACAAYYPLVTQLHEEFGDNLRIVYRHYPLTSLHPYAQTAALAAEAAGRQGKFWEMHDKLFENQRSWSSATLTEVNETFEGYAEELGLDLERFRADMDSSEVADAVDADRLAGNRAGVRGTPTFILQGETIQVRSYDEFKALVEAAFQQAGVDPKAVSAEEPATTTVEAVHKHADIAVYVRDQKVDLSQERYQSAEGAEKHPYLHLHDGNGEVLHAHANGYSLANFFASVGVTLSNECIALAETERYCANDIETLTGLVNGERVSDIAGYEFTDEDRILISFGNERNLDGEMAAVTDKACIYSETCPERGAPPAEGCVGGVGSNCEE